MGILDPSLKANESLFSLLDAGGDPDFDLNEAATHKPRKLPKPNLTAPKVSRVTKIKSDGQGRPLKITDQMARDIFTSDISAPEAAKLFDVSTTTVFEIRAKKRYAEATEGLTASNRRVHRRRLQPDMVMEIYNSVGSHASVARRLGVPENVVWSIKAGNSYRAVTGQERKQVRSR